MQVWGIYAFTDNDGEYGNTQYFVDKEDAWKYLRSLHEEKNKPLKFHIYPLEIIESKK